MDNLYGRRTNSSNKLSLSTHNGSAAGNVGDASASPFSSRTATFPKRFGGDNPSHAKANPFNTAPTPSARIMSPTAASSAFGLGSGAFSSFGSAKTPKTAAANPFDLAAKPSSTANTTTTTTTTVAPGSTLDKSSSGPASLTAPIGQSASGLAVGGQAVATTNLGKHPLYNEWVFWFRPPISKANGYIEYEKTLHPIAAVGTVEDFYTVYTHLKRSSTLPLVSDYHFFRSGIRPIWEDVENRKGGKWVVKLKKGVADRLWENLLLAMIGNQFHDCGDEVCGAVLSVRNGEDILSIWTHTEDRSILKVRETMKRALELPSNTKVEWKSHGSSLQQRTAMEESRREKSGSHYHQQHHNNNNNNDRNGNGNGNSNNYHHGYVDRRPSKPPLPLSGSGGDEQLSSAQGTIRSTP